MALADLTGIQDGFVFDPLELVEQGLAGGITAGIRLPKGARPGFGEQLALTAARAGVRAGISTVLGVLQGQRFGQSFASSYASNFTSAGVFFVSRQVGMMGEDLLRSVFSANAELDDRALELIRAISDATVDIETPDFRSDKSTHTFGLNSNVGRVIVPANLMPESLAAAYPVQLANLSYAAIGGGIVIGGGVYFYGGPVLNNINNAIDWWTLDSNGADKVRSWLSNWRDVLKEDAVPEYPKSNR